MLYLKEPCQNRFKLLKKCSGKKEVIFTNIIKPGAGNLVGLNFPFVKKMGISRRFNSTGT